MDATIITMSKIMTVANAHLVEEILELLSAISLILIIKEIVIEIFLISFFLYDDLVFLPTNRNVNYLLPKGSRLRASPTVG